MPWIRPEFCKFLTDVCTVTVDEDRSGQELALKLSRLTSRFDSYGPFYSGSGVRDREETRSSVMMSFVQIWLSSTGSALLCTHQCPQPAGDSYGVVDGFLVNDAGDRMLRPVMFETVPQNKTLEDKKFQVFSYVSNSHREFRGLSDSHRHHFLPVMLGIILCVHETPRLVVRGYSIRRTGKVDDVVLCEALLENTEIVGRILVAMKNFAESISTDPKCWTFGDEYAWIENIEKSKHRQLSSNVCIVEGHTVYKIYDYRFRNPCVTLDDQRKDKYNLQFIPNCERLIHFPADIHQTSFSIIKYPYMKGTHVAKTSKQFSVVANFLVQLHEQKLVHGDVRCCNIVFSDDCESAHVIDFDFCGETGSARYPAGFVVDIPDGARHDDVKPGVFMDVSHDVHALKAVMRLFAPVSVEHKTEWDILCGEGCLSEICNLRSFELQLCVAEELFETAGTGSPSRIVLKRAADDDSNPPAKHSRTS